MNGLLLDMINDSIRKILPSAVSEVLAGNGLRVYLTDGATPTPVISYAIVKKGAVGAVNITASHNPPTDNGLKVRNQFGGAIPPEELKIIESLIPSEESDVFRIELNEGISLGRIVKFDAAPEYIEQIHS